MGLYLIFYGCKVHSKAAKKYLIKTGLSSAPPYEEDKSSTIIISGIAIILLAKIISIMTIIMLFLPHTILMAILDKL
jgi:hypothetical protein